MNPFKWLWAVYKGFYNTSNTDRYIAYLRSLGMRIGEHVNFQMPRQTTMDVTRPWMIEIGSNIVFCSGLVMLTHGYDWCVFQHQDGEVLGSAGKIKMGNNIFVGVNVTITKGVTVGDNVIIGTGTLVNKDLPSNGVYAGVPARKIYDLDDYRQIRRAAQVDEAVECATEYYKVMGEAPPKDVMREFFFLFERDEAALPPVYQEVFQLKGNEDISRAFFRQHTPRFESYAAFLAHCGIPGGATQQNARHGGGADG